MRPILIVLLVATAASAADDNILALALRAQTDFDRVDLAASPTLPETLACVQSQAMILPVTRPSELSLIYYRKGYCELLGANLTKGRADYRNAAHDFERGIDTWPERTKKGVAVPPVSSGLRVLSDTAHLLADGNSDPRVSQDLEDAVNQPACAALDMPVTRCEALINVGRLWLGWIAMREARLADAGQWFSTFPNSGWPALIEGRRAMEVRQYAQAVGAFRRALENFGHAPNGGWAAAISPHPDEADTWFRLGSAEFEAKDYTSAVTSLERAVKLRPENARAIFERARAREMLGQSGLADYELASRTAFANVNAPGAGGQAHMFHGVALYRRRDFERAEQEFSSSLNFDAGWAKDDAVAWRHMAAVAGGACGQSAAQLRQSLEHVSDYFPRDEASGLVRTCPTAISEVVHPVAQ